MRKDKRVEKFLTSLYDAGGELTRTELSYVAFHRNLSRRVLDRMLAEPELEGLFTRTRAPRRPRPGMGRTNTAIRYCLTTLGWTVLVNGLRRGVQPYQINTEEVQHQLALLIQDSDPWALELMRQCAKGRAADAADERKRQEGINARKAARDRKAKFPSAPRHRSESELPARRAFLERKTGKVFGADGKLHAVAPAPMLPAAPTAMPTPSTAADSKWRYSTYRVTPTPPPSAHPATLDSTSATSAALSARIAAQGYQVDGAGRVLYAGNWISCEQWRQKMPHINL